MRHERMSYLRNIGIAAHIDAGKTTLTERILYLSGKTHKIGETHNGNSQMDTNRLEIAKGITISSAATQTYWEQEGERFTINIIDTPGHVDFMIEVERALRVLDGMVVLFDAVAGVESQSETVWQQAARYKVPAIAMVNKMDRAGADYVKVIEEIRKVLGANAIAIQMAIGSEEDFQGIIDIISKKAFHWKENGEMVEGEIPKSMLLELEKYRSELLDQLALFNEDFMEQYLSNPESICESDIRSQLRTAVLNRNLLPVVLGAAYKNKGVQLLMNSICDYLPSPKDRGRVEVKEVNSERSQYRQASKEELLSALVFKVAMDEQQRQLNFFRVYSGQVKIGDQVQNARTGKKERVARLYQMHANKKIEIQSLQAGEIGATTSLKSFRTGDTICNLENAVTLESLFVPKPVLQMAVEPKRNTDRDKLSLAFAKLQLEDPSFKVQSNEENGELIMKGMGELQFEILLDKLKSDFGIEVNLGKPQVAYQERFLKSIDYKHRLKKQTGGSGLFAEIAIKAGPADSEFLKSKVYADGMRLQFVNSMKGGGIPKEYIPAIKKGFLESLNSGCLANFPVESLKIELIDGNGKEKDSNAFAFESCAKACFKVMSNTMEPVLLEPMMEVEVTTPQDYLGNVLAGIHRRRGMIISQESLFSGSQIKAEAPLAEMFGYINHLRTVSSGKAIYAMRFKRYEVLPMILAEEILNRS